jgi:2-(3-amino-3-carboxypropyl)histidine synthase
MEKKSISDIEKEYELELEKIIQKIKKEKAKKVLLQFPDGMKLYSTIIAEEIEKRTDSECIIWMGSCFGGCDVPNASMLEEPEINLIVQFGHSEWDYKKR